MMVDDIPRQLKSDGKFNLLKLSALSSALLGAGDAIRGIGTGVIAGSFAANLGM